MQHGSVGMMAHSEIVLASRSPRRRELLGLTGWQAEIQSVDIDEEEQGGDTPVEIVLRVAQAKLAAAREAFPQAARILTADTIVADGERILGKPQDQQGAYQMLKVLGGREHQVITAVGLYDRTSDRIDTETCRTQVPMRAYDDDEIHAYVATGSPLDKAGAYGIQDVFFNPVCLDLMKGCFANVMGLPLCTLIRMTATTGLNPRVDIPEACQRYNRYNCSVYAQILRGEACEKSTS